MASPKIEAAADTEEVVEKVALQGGSVGFCGSPPADDPEEQTDGTHKGAAAVVRSSGIWQGRQRLWVYFLNPDFLTKNWGLSTSTIIEWACVWGKVMVFKETTILKNGEVRVEFTDSDAEGSWSVVGMDATRKVKSSNPTMKLNLNTPTKEAPTKEAQRSLVIHEFGHVLGLEHEHQRSDFWDGVEKHIDMNRMKNDDRVKHHVARIGEASFGAQWFKTEQGILSTIRKFVGSHGKSDDVKCLSEYDSKSIMHYAFDKHWLKNPNHHELRNVLADKSLSEKEKKCICGIHSRHNGLADDPSETDITELMRVYGKDHNDEDAV